MSEELQERIKRLVRRAGLARVPTPVLLAAFALLAVAVVAALLRWWPQPQGDGELVSRAAAVERPAIEASATSTAASTTICVHIVGAVKHPGVITLTSGARVEAAVAAAGGFSDEAAEQGINLAALLSDGEQVVVPTEEEVKAGGVRASGGGGVGKPGASGSQLNLNTADATQLDALPGVGPSTAAKIVADRQANGPFKAPDDLGRVPGIGPKKLDQLKPLVCVR
jgi:competence protein ComEA